MLKCIVLLFESIILMGFVTVYKVSAADLESKPIPIVLDESHGSFLGIVLESSTANDLTRIFGPAKPVLLNMMGEEGDPTHGPYVYSYYSKVDPSLYVSFWVGGSESPEVYRYILEKKEQPHKKDSFCSSSFNKNVKTGGGVKIGMLRSEFIKLFPGTPETLGNTMYYHYEKLVKYAVPRPTGWNSKVAYTGEWYYGTVEGTFENERLIRYSIELGGEMDW